MSLMHNFWSLLPAYQSGVTFLARSVCRMQLPVTQISHGPLGSSDVARKKSCLAQM